MERELLLVLMTMNVKCLWIGFAIEKYTGLEYRHTIKKLMRLTRIKETTKPFETEDALEAIARLERTAIATCSCVPRAFNAIRCDPLATALL